MMKLKLVVSGLVAAALFVPSTGAAYSRPLSEEVAEAIAPIAAEGEAAPATTTEAAPAPAPAPAATATATPAPAATTEKKASASLTAEELEESSGFGLGVDLDNSMAASSFMAGQVIGYDDNGNPQYCETCAFVGGSLGVSARYTGKLAGVKLSVSGRWGFSVEYTNPDNDNARRFSHSDLRLGVSAPGIVKIPVIDVTISPSIGLSVPLTAESWNSGLILGASAGVGLSRGWKYVSVSLSGNISHGFYTSTANYGVQRKDFTIQEGEGRNTFLCRTGESVCGINGMNPALGIGGNLAVNIRPLDALSFGITYGLSHSWKYAVTDVVDENTCHTYDSNGNLACRSGMGNGDRMSTNISASYSFTDNLAATLYLQNSQQPRTINQSGEWAFRFPFADLATPASGATAIGLSLSGNFNF
jgi:hypothetical protein